MPKSGTMSISSVSVSRRSDIEISSVIPARDDKQY